MCFREGPGKLHKSLLPQELRFAGFKDFQGWMRGTWIPIYVIGMGRALPLDALQRVADRGVCPALHRILVVGLDASYWNLAHAKKNMLL